MESSWHRVRSLDRGEDVIPVCEESGVACFMKLFPMCASQVTLPLDDYQRFHLRFYVPLEILLDPGRRADRLVILTNGLDELHQYTLYDELGMRLAGNGLPCVLLPLPDHLNRHTAHRIQAPTFEQVVTPSSHILKADPIKLYHRYLQFKAELAVLRAHVHGHECAEAVGGSCSIYRKLFSPGTRISYLGYSLGACGMLADFLENEPTLNACILLSGAINLKDIISEKLMPQSEWDAFVGGLTDAFRDARAKQATTLADQLFEEVFLGQYGGRKCGPLLKEHGRRVLFVLGGRDKLISPSNFEALAPKDWGLGLFVLPGINHFLPIDEEWKRWSSLVIHLITRFEMNAIQRQLTEDDVVSASGADTRAKTGLIQRDEVLERARYVAWRAAEIVASRDERQAVREQLKGKSFVDLRLGLRLVKAGLISSAELALALKEHAASQRRLGDIVVDQLRLVRREIVEALVAGPTAVRSMPA